MRLPLLIVGAALLVVAIVVAARALEARLWQRSLYVYRITLPATVDGKQLSAWFSALAAITHRPDWSLLPLPPVGIETVATASGIVHRLLVSRRNEQAVLSSLRATIPGVRVSQDEAYQRPQIVHALESGLTSRDRPLAHDRAEATAATLLASLQPVPANGALVVQVLLTSAGTPGPVKQASTEFSRARVPWLLEGEAPVDAEAVSQLRKKFESPLLHAVVRLGAAGVSKPAALALGGRAWSAFQTLNAPGVRVVRRYLPSRVVARRLSGLVLPWLRWPLLLNSRELLGLSGLPVGPLFLPGLALGGARQLPAPAALSQTGLILGRSNYPGQTDRPLALDTRERLRHAYVVGPTGSGKSWLLANCILQDIAAGHGVFAVDVKGDLISDVLARVGPQDEDRLLVINPVNRSRPTGLNVLQHSGSEAARELVVDNVLHIFRELWHGFWGPRTDYILRGALRTLTLARTTAGENLTLVELSALLTQPAFRRGLLARTDLPPDLVGFWQRYGAMSEGERAQVIGPTLNKVDAFTSRSAIRLLLGQSAGVALTDIFTRRRVVLVSLDKGQLGAETANLLGALSVASLWQAALTRAAVPTARRHPVFAYLDEAQDIVRLPLAIADMLAQARGYGLGMTLANQYVAQLPETIRAAILGTVRTALTFQVDYDDARLLERRFAPLTRDDLQGLAGYEFALRPSVGGQTLASVTGFTLPLAQASADPRAVAERAAQRHGRPRSDVERAIQNRVAEQQHPANGFGRQPGRDAR